MAEKYRIVIVDEESGEHIPTTTTTWLEPETAAAMNEGDKSAFLVRADGEDSNRRAWENLGPLEE